MKRKFFVSIMTVLTLFMTACALQDEWPDTYENVEWVQISREDAVSVWEGYDTQTVRRNSLTVWTKGVGKKAQKWTGGSISGDTYENAAGNFALTTVGNLTINPADEPENSVFYKASSGSNLIKIENPPLDSDNENFDVKIYENGWAVVIQNYRGYTTGYDFYYIKYN